MSKMQEFMGIYRLYRRAGHGPRYAARIAWDCVFKHLPF